MTGNHRTQDPSLTQLLEGRSKAMKEDDGGPLGGGVLPVIVTGTLGLWNSQLTPMQLFNPPKQTIG